MHFLSYLDPTPWIGKLILTTVPMNDQILALDKRFVDPRRTLNPSQAEKEEGIIPLTDSLPIIPQVPLIPDFHIFVWFMCTLLVYVIVSILMHLSYFTVIRNTLPQSRRSKRHNNSSGQARVNYTRLCLWSGSFLHKACSFKDI